MKKKIILTQILLVFVIILSQAQPKPEHDKTSYVDEQGKLYWNKELPVYLRISSTPNGEGHLLESETHKEYVNPLYFDTEGKNYIRTRWAVDKKTGKEVYPREEVLWEVYADGIAPKSNSKFNNAPKYFKNNVQYYGKNLNVTLSTSDNTSGIKQLFYSADKNSYKEYKNNIQFNQGGEFQLLYYAVDNVGNSEKIKEKEFVVDITPPVSSHVIVGISLTGENIISTGTVISLSSMDTQSGVAQVYFQIDNKKKQIYNGKKVPIAYLENGEHTLKYFSVDNVENREDTVFFNFYLDKHAPILTSDILGDRYIVNDQVYFSGRTKLKLTAVDNKAGVQEIIYSVDSDGFNTYDAPFYLPKKPGFHIVKYFATDKTENTTKKTGSHKYNKYQYSTEKIYVDLTGPTLSFDYVGDYYTTRDTVFINKDTKIRLKATDKEAGLQYISYSMDGVQEETKYSEPFTIQNSGTHTIEYFGYDNVNNRNRNEFYFVCDSDPPEPIWNFSIQAMGEKDGLNIYPFYVLLYLAATDATIGTKEIYYSVNNKTEQKYNNHISGFVKNKINIVKVRAVDKLENEKITEIKFYVQ